jgi:hypothetical protein
MSEPESPHTNENEAPEPVLAPGALTVLLVLLLVIFAGVAVFATHDRASRTSLETTAERTGVGDTRLVKEPEGATMPAAPLMTHDGHPLYLQRLKKFAARDSRMEKIGIDDSKTYTLYRSGESGNKVPNDPGTFYVKCATNAYLQVGEALPKK